MLIQPITNQSNYTNYKIQKRNNTTSFKGEIGAKLLKEVGNAGNIGVEDLLKKQVWQ